MCVTSRYHSMTTTSSYTVENLKLRDTYLKAYHFKCSEFFKRPGDGTMNAIMSPFSDRRLQYVSVERYWLSMQKSVL